MFTPRLPWLILTGRLLDEHVLALRRWADWATDVAETWPDDITGADPPLRAQQDMADRIDAVLNPRPEPGR